MNRIANYVCIALLSLFSFASAEYCPSYAYASKTLEQLLQEQQQLEAASRFYISISMGNSHRIPGPSEFHMNILRRNRALQKLAAAQEEVEKAIATVRKQQENAQRQQLQKEQQVMAAQKKQREQEEKVRVAQEKQQQTIAVTIQTVRTEAQALPNSHPEVSWYKEQIHDTCDLADEANNKKAFSLAIALTNFGKKILVCAKAAALGAWDGSKEIVTAALHPVDTVKGMAADIADTAMLVLKECGVNFRDYARHMNDSDRLLFDNFEDMDVPHIRLFDYMDNIEWLVKTLRTIPEEQLTYQAAKLGIQVLILHRAVGLVSKIADNGLIKIKNYMQKSSGTYSVLLDDPTIQAANSLSEHIFETVFEPEKPLQPKKVGALSPATLEYITLEEELVSLRQEWMSILPESFPLRHIFLPEIQSQAKRRIITKHPSGWHHDYKERLFKKGYLGSTKLEITNRVNGEYGVYKFDWGVPGLDPKKSTFFPSEWTQDQVLEKISEGLVCIKKNKNIKSQIINERTRNIEYAVLSSDGMSIRVVKDASDAVVTIFPLLEEII